MIIWRSNAGIGKLLIGAPVVSPGVLAAGCGSSNSTSSGTTQAQGSTTRTHAQTAPTTAQLGAHYLAIVAPMNAALQEANKRLAGASSSVQAQAALAPMVPAVNTGDSELMHLGLTGEGGIYMRTVLSTDRQLVYDIKIGDFSNLTSITAAHAAAVNEVRADLGLPPVTGGATE